LREFAAASSTFTTSDALGGRYRSSISFGVTSNVTKRKPATVLRFHAVLRAALAQATRWGWIDFNRAL